MILIKNCLLYSPEFCSMKDILIEGSRIALIEDKIDLSLKDLVVIDAEGCMVHPGLIDSHVHAIGGGGEGGMISRVPPLCETAIAKEGITTVIGLLGTDGISRSVKDLLCKIKGYREWGLNAWCLTGSYEIPSTTITNSVSDDIAFIDEVIGLKVAINDHRCSFPTTGELIRVLSQVRIASLLSGKCGIMHVHVGALKDGIKQLFEIVNQTAIPINHIFPTHMENHVKDAKQWLNLGGHVDLTCHKNADDVALSLLEVNEDKVSLSTDSNGSFPIWNENKSEIVGMGVGSISMLRVYLDRMIEKTNNPALALKAFTQNPAKSMKLKNKGQIKVGYDADIVIRDNKEIRYSISNGQILVKEKVCKESYFKN